MKVEKRLPVTRTSAGLRVVLFDELDRLRSGEADVPMANATARLAKGIVETVFMEIEVYKLARLAPVSGTALRGLDLDE